MKIIRSIFFALQILLAALVLAVIVDVITVNITNIKAYDRKITQQSYNYYGGTYEWDEVKGNLHWEDGAFILNKDYETQLMRDLKLLSDEYTDIAEIDYNENVLTSGDYKVKICVEDFDYTIKDTTLTKSLGRSNFSGYLELYDESMENLLFKYRDRRFMISNRLTITGLAEEQYIENKIKELLYTEIIALTSDFIWRYDLPQKRRKAIFATKAIVGTYWGIPLEKSEKRVEDNIRIASTEIESTENNEDSSQ